MGVIDTLVWSTDVKRGTLMFTEMGIFGNMFFVRDLGVEKWNTRVNILCSFVFIGNDMVGSSTVRLF